MPTVAIVGLGLMGSSFAMALNAAKGGQTVVGSDRDPHTVRKALEQGIVASAAEDLSVVDIADLVVVAVPILAMRETLAALGPRVKGKVVTDMASTK